jgi:hypothetical protein
MLIKTADGMRLGGAWTAPSIENGTAEFAAGMTAEAEFEFVCVLNPGAYLISVAAFASEAGIEYALHGLQDALRFRIEAGSESAAIGAVDFGIRPALSLMARPVA